jgi:hypothetical protein
VAWFEQKGVAPCRMHVHTDERPLYGVEWLRDNFPEELPKGATYQIYLQVRNAGGDRTHELKIFLGLRQWASLNIC